jgi:hypothetical protein
VLKQIAAATSKGVFVGAAEDKKSLDDAFGQVIAVIQGQVILED